MGISIATFHVYTFFTNVEKEDVNKQIGKYTSKCSISRDETVELFSYIAADAAKKPVAEVQDKVLSEYKARAGQGNAGDVLITLWFNFQKYIGYNHEQKIEQVAMKAGLNALKEHMDKCNLSDAVASSKRFYEALSAPANISPGATGVHNSESSVANEQSSNKPKIISESSDKKLQSKISVVVKDRGGYSESGDGYTFSTLTGEKFYVYNAGGSQLRIGEELIKPNSEICVTLDPVDGMGDVSSIVSGVCSSELK